MIRRQIKHKADNEQYVTYPCPVCGRKRKHFRFVSGSIETLVCSWCGNELKFKL